MDSPTRVVFLIGFMASGKTTLTNAIKNLAEDVETFDLDDEVERAAGCSIKEIFATRGEDAFRELESSVLHRLAAEAGSVPRIIACGGGTPCHRGNMEFMNSTGQTVRLSVTPERIFSRLMQFRSERPLVASLSESELMEKITTMLADREPYYSRCRHSFGANRLESEAQVRNAALRFIRRFL